MALSATHIIDVYISEEAHHMYGTHEDASRLHPRPEDGNKCSDQPRQFIEILQMDLERREPAWEIVFEIRQG